MERSIPILKLDNECFFIKTDRGVFVHSMDPFNRMPIKAIQTRRMEDFFLVAYDPRFKRLLSVEDLATAASASIRLYWFPGLDKLDPIGYAVDQGRPVPTEYLVTAPVVTCARQIRLSRYLRRQLIQEQEATVGRLNILQRLVLYRNGNHGSG